MKSFVLSISGAASLQMILRALDLLAQFGIDPDGIELAREDDRYTLIIIGTAPSAARLSALTAKLRSIVAVTDVVQRLLDVQHSG